MHADKLYRQKTVCFAKETKTETYPFRQESMNEIKDNSNTMIED